MTTDEKNPLGLNGIEFVEFVSPEPENLHHLFSALGFSRTRRHTSLNIDLYHQNEINFLVNRGPATFGARFSREHGPCIASMGWRVSNARMALQSAISRGARECTEGDLRANGEPIPAIYGIGNSIIYLVQDHGSESAYRDIGFLRLQKPDLVEPKGFVAIDHLTNNVPRGEMKRWAGFYRDVFGFTEVRYFDIRGVKTGLQSYALRSPCGKFCIPINEGTEEQSQINEYLREYGGPGIQHLALLTDDILESLRRLEGTPVQLLDIESNYYDNVFERVPNVTEDREQIRKYGVLVDGDPKGYLLQIFTRNLIGPIFIEIIQRKNHLSFGEGNFEALFRSLERDQQKRGVF